MRHVWLIFMASILATSLWAADERPRIPELEATIDGQMSAFLDDDFAGAFEFASPSIQGIFGSVERFGQMVRGGYPMVWRHGEVRYLELREIDGALWQKIFVRDQAGKSHILDYQMVETQDGWRINGVQLLRAPGVGA